MKRIIAAICAVLTCTLLSASARKYELKSPDGHLKVGITIDKSISYSVELDGVVLLAPSAISMDLADGTSYDGEVPFRGVSRKSVDRSFDTPFYKRSEVKDRFNELTLKFRTFNIVWRAYDDGVAYRFVSLSKVPFKVVGENSSFVFPEDWHMFVPYVARDTDSLEEQFYNSSENTYNHTKLSEWDRTHLAFLPILVEGPGNIKVVLTEADLLHYPGMYLYNGDGSTTLHGVFPSYPKTIEQGGHNNLQGIVTSREDYLASCNAGESFPWRVVAVSRKDASLSASDLIFRLASPAEDVDWSWVRPGKVAWDWWNDWNIDGVDFEAGINNETYKYYIDFASEKGIEYVILDEGWSVNLAADLMQVIPEIDLEMICEYAASKGVGIILWAGYAALDRDMERVMEHYSKMGVKGFKVDFMDRDDQMMVDFYVRAAAVAAKYHLMVDFHGAYKPTGLSRTYPNVINYEGVHGLEQMKWAGANVDQVTYDVTVPYIRMFAGPMDYTQGAMRNATRQNYRPVNSEPMSQGTRCRQLAEYVIFDAPLTMLCDSPSAYKRESQCTGFIASIPTVWDETVALDGKISQYISLARRSGDTWYVGALTDWNQRDMILDLGFLPDGEYDVTIFCDGANAHRIARDYNVEYVKLGAKDRSMLLHMAPGGGWVARITPR